MVGVGVPALAGIRAKDRLKAGLQRRTSGRVRYILLAAVALCHCGWSAETKANNSWVHVDEGKTGVRNGSALLWAAELKRMLLVGPVEGAPFVQAFDPASQSWREWTSAVPAGRDVLHPYYQAAYDPGGQTIYCLSGGPILYALNLVEKKWKARPPATEIEDLSWHTMDPKIKRLIGQRLQMARGERPVDFGMAEALAFGSLLRKGIPVRLSGPGQPPRHFQPDAMRCSSSTETAAEYTPLCHVQPNPPSPCVPLSVTTTTIAGLVSGARPRKVPLYE